MLPRILVFRIFLFKNENLDSVQKILIFDFVLIPIISSLEAALPHGISEISADFKKQLQI